MTFIREIVLFVLLIFLSYCAYGLLNEFYVSPCWVEYTSYLDSVSEKSYLTAEEARNLDSIYEEIRAKSSTECYAGHQRLAWLAAIAIGVLGSFVCRVLVAKVRYVYIFIAVTFVTAINGFFVLSIFLAFFSCLSAFATDYGSKIVLGERVTGD